MDLNNATIDCILILGLLIGCALFANVAGRVWKRAGVRSDTLHNAAFAFIVAAVSLSVAELREVQALAALFGVLAAMLVGVVFATEAARRTHGAGMAVWQVGSILVALPVALFAAASGAEVGINAWHLFAGMPVGFAAAAVALRGGDWPEWQSEATSEEDVDAGRDAGMIE